jgi:hypothetical protein
MSISAQSHVRRAAIARQHWVCSELARSGVVPSDTGWFFTTLAENALARDDWEFTAW